MVEGVTGVAAAQVVLRELALFAACGCLIGSLDELVIDVIWIARGLWRRFTVYRRHPRADVATLDPPRRPGRIAVFVPAWDEAAVIGPMLRRAVAAFGGGDYRLYVGCYPNDPATLAEIRAVAADAPQVRAVICSRPGPTTKADCLNHLWQALLADETTEEVRAKAVLLHDAEDVVHPAEIAVLDRLIERFDLVQFPVVPLAAESGWLPRLVSGQNHQIAGFREFRTA